MSLPAPLTRATAIERVPHALGAIEAGTEVIIERVAPGTVRVHIPSDGIMFTTTADKFRA